MDKYNRKDINYPWGKYIYPAYISKPNSNHEKQIILLMVSDREGWHYLAVTRRSALLRGVTSKHDFDFFFLKWLHSFRTKNKLESHKKVCENKHLCSVGIPCIENIILEFS